jgi:hypothetical protein
MTEQDKELERNMMLLFWHGYAMREDRRTYLVFTVGSIALLVYRGMPEEETWLLYLTHLALSALVGLMALGFAGGFMRSARAWRRLHPGFYKAQSYLRSVGKEPKHEEVNHDQSL